MLIPLRDEAQRQQERAADRRVGLISLSMWAGTAVRVFPALTPLENAQSALAMVVMAALVVAWPTAAPASYSRWRLPILAFLRTFLVALPFNFSLRVFDAIAPSAGSGRLAVVSNLFQTFLSVRIALLTFTSLGWRVPFRLHLLLQTVNVTLFVCFGLHPYCESKLLRSPELQSAAASLHRAMATSASIFLPNMGVSIPEGPLAQRRAFILFCWAVLGWLLPTLLLLPDAATRAAADALHTQQQQQRPGGRSLAGSRLAQLCNDGLRGFEGALSALQLPPLWRRRRRPAPAAAEAGQPPALDDGDELLPVAASFALAWWLVLLAVWMVSCLLAADPLH